MTPTRLLIGQILVVFAIMALGVWAATQWAAAMLAYQPELGLAWFELRGLPVYRPWALFGWWFHYEAYAPAVFNKAGALAAASGFMGCAAAVAGSLWRARQSSNVTTYGSARWATEVEVRRAGFFGDAGVFLGCLGGAYLRHDGPDHVMAFAPTRSGKGIGLVVPTLLSWTGSAVIHDIKGENWELTAGWRSRFSHALLFNPTDARSAHYNPLLEVRRGAEEVRDVQNIADILVDPGLARGMRRGAWTRGSGDLRRKKSHARAQRRSLAFDQSRRAVRSLSGTPATHVRVTLKSSVMTMRSALRPGAMAPVLSAMPRKWAGVLLAIRAAEGRSNRPCLIAFASAAAIVSVDPANTPSWLTRRSPSR